MSGAPHSCAPLPIVVLSGSPFERGRQHGAAFGGLIRDALRRLPQGRSSEVLAAARQAAASSWRLAQVRALDVAEELAGMAQGAECNVLDLYLNVGFEFFPEPPVSGCSGVAIARNGGAVVGQNWDAPPDTAGDLALFLHLDERGVALAMVASIGTLGWVGCNRDGLALITNDLMLDAVSDGLPSQVVRRLVLAEANVPAALTAMQGLPHMGGRCYLLGDAQGAVAGMELSPRAGVRIIPEVGRILHTNHARLEETAGLEDENRLQAIYPSSRPRLASLTATAGDASSAEEVMAALRDRTNAPNAVSKTVSAEENTQTCFSIIVDCGRRVLHLCAGPPAIGTYIPIHLGGAAPS